MNERSRLVLVFGFQGALVVLALGLALLFDLSPWRELDARPSALWLSLGATLPMVAGLWLLDDLERAWARSLRQVVDELIVPLFRGAGWPVIALVALLAGVGEELLFRGVIQAGLSGLIGPWAGLLIASLLFGLAHAITRAYFVVTFVVGLYLGLLYHWTGNLLVPILVHFVYDWVALHYYCSRSRFSLR